eukprot:gene9007-biopygen21194
MARAWRGLQGVWILCLAYFQCSAVPAALHFHHFLHFPPQRRLWRLNSPIFFYCTPNPGVPGGRACLVVGRCLEADVDTRTQCMRAKFILCSFPHRILLAPAAAAAAAALWPAPYFAPVPDAVALARGKPPPAELGETQSGFVRNFPRVSRMIHAHGMSFVVFSPEGAAAPGQYAQRERLGGGGCDVGPLALPASPSLRSGRSVPCPGAPRAQGAQRAAQGRCGRRAAPKGD